MPADQNQAEFPVEIFAALSDGTRSRLLRLLLERNLCVGALARELGVSEPAVSQHLKKLRGCGLVTGEKAGYWMHYSVNTELLHRAADTLRGLAQRGRGGVNACPRRGVGGTCCCPAKKGQTGLRELGLEPEPEGKNEPE